MRPLTGRLLARVLGILAASFLTFGVLVVTLAGAHPLPVAGFALALYVVLAVAISVPVWTLGRRLEAITEAASNMANGDLAARAPVDAHDEVARLARSVNDIVHHADVRIAESAAQRDASDSVLDNLEQGLAMVSRDLWITHANARFWELVGVKRPLMPARLSITRQPLLEEVVVESESRGGMVTREVALYVDEKLEVEISAAPIARGTTPGAWLLSIQDLRPEKVMASLRREFVANASHELKTPLTSIRGYAETLLSGGLEDTENRARFVETIRTQASRLEALVEDLLELADLERPDAPLDLKDWDMGTIAREMGETFEDVAGRRGLALRVESRRGILARVDRTKIELALRNLLDNAIKYTESGSIGISVRQSEEKVRVTVADTGRGIGPEHLQRIFERFYRVDRGRSRELGGTGLGLSIVKHAVLLHHGEVGVDSEPGKGSVFWFEVPKRGPAEGPKAVPGAES
jgi:two-component system phosphate regulon sensor histidine kinase PhoR